MDTVAMGVARGKMLDIGCGRAKFHPEAVGVDCYRLAGVDVIANLDRPPYPLPAKSFDYVHASHVMEHLHNTVEVMEEIHRLLKPGGHALIRVPHYSGQMAYCNPQHVRFFSLGSFDCFSGDTPEYSAKRFEIVKKELHWSCVSLKGKQKAVTALVNKTLTFLGNVNPRICERYWIYWVGGFEEMDILLKKA
jgi:SAM-dependent methyltransferase